MLPSLILGAVGKKMFQGSKNAIAHGIRHGMGTVGGFLADRIQKDESDNPTFKKSETPKSQQSTEINAKAVGSIEQMGKQVSDAINVTIRTTNKGFVFVNRYMDHYGEQVSRSLESLGNLLTRLLYERQKNTTPQSILVSRNQKKDDDGDGLSWLGILGALYTAKKVVSFLKNTSIISKLLGKKTAVEILKKPGILKSLLSPAFKPFKYIAKGLKWLVPVDVALSAFNFTEAYNRDPSKETSSDVLGDYGWTALTGAAAGGTLGAMAGPIGAVAGAIAGGAAGIITMFYNRSYRKNGSVNSIDINKIIFDANKIKFDALNTLEFKKRFLDDGIKAGTLNKLADKMIGGRGGAGFFNNMLDEAVDSVKQHGVLGSINNVLRGGPGGAGTLNGMADRVFGVGQKNNSKQNSATATPSTQKGNQDGLVIEEQDQVARIRKQPISSKLRSELEYAAKQAGVKVKIYSGGQDSHGPNRTGSHRHDHGNSADLKLMVTDKDGKERLLDMRSPEDAAIMENFTRNAVKAGATGVGAGINYMGPNSLHIGGGKPAAWGAGGSVRANDIPDWLIRAHKQGMEEQKKFKLDENKPVSFGDISPLSNEAMSKDQTIPWKNRNDWGWMRRSPNIDDRRGAADPYKDDQYSIATQERKAIDYSSMSYWEDTVKQLPSQTLLGKQLGVDKLNPIEKPIDLGPILKPSNVPENTTRPKEEKQSSYQGLLDHRREKRVYDTNTFANYFSTENNLGEA